MSPAVPQERTYTLSQHEGWLCHAERSRRTKPDDPSAGFLAGLSRRDMLIFNEQRHVWHANMGPYLTPAMLEVTDAWDTVVQANRQDGDKVRSSIALDAWPGLGKTTLAVQFATEFHRNQIDVYGRTTIAGHDRIPVAYVSLSSNTTMKSLNAALCRFYAHPSDHRGTAAELGARAGICAREAETRLIVFDDLHFLDVSRRDGRDVANHFKWLASEFQTTFMFVGVGIAERGLLNEGLGPAQAHFAQTARRWTRTTLEPFSLDDDGARLVWRRLLKAIERDVVLAEKQPGMLADGLSGYLYERSSGHFQSLMSLISRGCARAIKTGTETLTKDLLDQVRIDEAAEAARQRMRAGLNAPARSMRRTV